MTLHHITGYIIHLVRESTDCRHALILYLCLMKYFLPIVISAMLMTGCKKNSCVQCSIQVAVKPQTTTVTTNYEVNYVEFCGLQADTAMSITQDYYPYFAAEHGITMYTCFYNQ